MCSKARTVCGALKVLGLKGETTFAKYHHVLNRSHWNTLKAGKILLQEIDNDQQEALKLVIDGHLERRKGKKISAKGHYRDAVQSSDKYTVISSGLKWLSVMALKRFSWSKRALALPFLTILAPHEESNKKAGKKHKTLQDWTCQIVIQIRRWLPNRKIILVGDNEFATAAIALSCIKHKIAFVSRLKLKARLFNFPARNRVGRPRKKGLRLPTIESILNDPDIRWETKEVAWYGGIRKTIQFFSETCLWHVMSHSSTPIPIRYVLVKDPENKMNPALLMSTDLEMIPWQIIEVYVERWNVEVTFHEAREHLGIETQRQWSDLAIARTTPILFGLYSLAILLGSKLFNARQIEIEKTAWYEKTEVKFSDILRGIRKLILQEKYFCNDVFSAETAQKSPIDFISRVKNLLLEAA